VRITLLLSSDKPYPATVVTEDGDVPLIGGWPTK